MIEVKNLTKRYGSHTAVNDLSFTIQNGVIYGFLGPNGAGKSTTMNIITGCLSLSEGEVLVDGKNIMDEPIEAKKKIGYLPELPPLYQDMTPNEYLKFVAEAKGIKKSQIKDEIKRVAELTEITDVLNRLIKNLSKGYKQRVGIAQALLGNPETIILDEPTVGLDPRQIIEIRELIKNLGKTHTIILSSHILSEVRAVCDRVMIISHGKLVASDTPENLSNLFSSKATVEIEALATEDTVKNILDGIDEIEGYNISAQEGVTGCSITPKENTDIRAIIFNAFADKKCPLITLTQNKPDLEDIFIELTGQEDNIASEDNDETDDDNNDNQEAEKEEE